MKKKTAKPLATGKTKKNATPAAKARKTNNPPSNPDKDPLPGYPYYPPSQDIMNQGNQLEKKLLAENDEPRFLLSQGKPEHAGPLDNFSMDGIEEEEKESMNTPNEADITRDDLMALGSDEVNMAMADDAELLHRAMPVDMAGSDLDVPGTELDDENEMIGAEDEENNTYSIGGDRHDNLEENSAEPETND